MGCYDNLRKIEQMNPVSQNSKIVKIIEIQIAPNLLDYEKFAAEEDTEVLKSFEAILISEVELL